MKLSFENDYHFFNKTENIILNNILIMKIIFKNNNLINSVETINIFEIEDGVRNHFALTTQGRCERVIN